MSKLTKIALLGSLAIASCKEPVKPIRENFNEGIVVFENRVLRDDDKDRRVDCILRDDGALLYVAEGMECSGRDTYYTKTMTPEVRESASNAYNAINDLAFRLAMEDYKQSKKE